MNTSSNVYEIFLFNKMHRPNFMFILNFDEIVTNLIIT